MVVAEAHFQMHMLVREQEKILYALMHKIMKTVRRQREKEISSSNHIERGLERRKINLQEWGILEFEECTQYVSVRTATATKSVARTRRKHSSAHLK